MLERFDFDVKAAVEDAQQLLKAVDEHRPQLVITDVRLPPTFRDEGLRRRALRAAHPGLKVVVLSQYVEQTYAAELLGRRPGRRRLPPQGPRGGRPSARQRPPPGPRRRHRRRPRSRAAPARRRRSTA